MRVVIAYVHGLEQDGIVTRRQALRTIVAPRVGPDLVAVHRLPGFDWLLREKEHKVNIDVSWSRSPVPDELAKLFAIEHGAERLLTENLYFADGEFDLPTRSVLQRDRYVAGAQPAAVTVEFSSECCREPFDHAVAEIMPVVERIEQTTELAVRIGGPFARLHERHYSSEGRPIAFLVIDIGDRFIRFGVVRRR